MDILVADSSKKAALSLTRKTLYAALFGCLFFPLLLVTVCKSSVSSKGVILLATLALLAAAAIGWFLLHLWEKKMQRLVTQLVQARIEKIGEIPHDASQEEKHHLLAELEKVKIGYEHQINLLNSSVAKSKDEVHQLHLEMDKKLEEMRLAYLEFEDLRKEYRRLEEEAKRAIGEAQESICHKEALINEYQKTITEQRMIIEKKQRYIAKLEGKVRDLMYEIRSLLQLEAPSKEILFDEVIDLTQDSLIDTYVSSSQRPYDYSLQLQKYVEKAESLTGVDHLGYVGGKSPRFLDLALDSYAVDKRPLFDSFKDESGGAIFIYSLLEKKFLFVNPAIKTLTGWSQEKFMKEFARLVTKGYQEWEEALSTVKYSKQSSAKLFIHNKTGQIRPIECYIGAISKGPFTHHAIGIFT